MSSLLAIPDDTHATTSTTTLSTTPTTTQKPSTTSTSTTQKPTTKTTTTEPTTQRSTTTERSTSTKSTTTQRRYEYKVRNPLLERKYNSISSSSEKKPLNRLERADEETYKDVSWGNVRLFTEGRDRVAESEPMAYNLRDTSDNASYPVKELMRSHAQVQQQPDVHKTTGKEPSYVTETIKHRPSGTSMKETTLKTTPSYNRQWATQNYHIQEVLNKKPDLEAHPNIENFLVYDFAREQVTEDYVSLDVENRHWRTSYMGTKISQEMLDEIYGRTRADIIAMGWTTKKDHNSVLDDHNRVHLNDEYAILDQNNTIGKVEKLFISCQEL